MCVACCRVAESDDGVRALRRNDHGTGCLWRVRVPIGSRGRRQRTSEGVELLDIAVLKGGERHPRLNISGNPIAKKYREGKLKRTLERE